MFTHIGERVPADYDAAEDGPASDIFDVRRELTPKTEFATFGDFQAQAGHMFDAERQRAIWELVTSWLWRADRGPRFEECIWAARELAKTPVEEVLKRQGITTF